MFADLENAAAVPIASASMDESTGNELLREGSDASGSLPVGTHESIIDKVGEV